MGSDVTKMIIAEGLDVSAFSGLLPGQDGIRSEQGTSLNT